MKPIKLERDPWHLSKDKWGYITHDGQFRLRRNGLGWNVEHDRNGVWEFMKAVPNLKTAREFIQSHYSHYSH